VSLETAILGVLNNSPRSGYDLKRRCFAGSLGALWPADQAQIYRTLERLKSLGLVSSRRKRQSTRPDRYEYALTPSGREALGDRLVDSLPLPSSRDGFLVQLYFASDVDDASLLRLMRERRHKHQERLDVLRTHSAAIASDTLRSAARENVLKQTALDGAIAEQRALIDWLDECIDAVQAGALPGSEIGVGQRSLFGT
jgi:PadR family transcriptional regulator, regulatory protein AphA